MLTPTLPDAVSALALLHTAGGHGGWVPISQTITEWIHSFAGSPLALLVLAGLCFTDAFFPPVPAESIVIGLTSWYFASPGHVVALPGIFLCAVIGATLGDSFAFFLGTRIHVQRFKSWRGGKGEQAFERTAKLLHKRGTSFIFAARFVPGGRVAVNMCAGATGFPYSRFIRTDLAAVICWVSYGMSIGFASGSILGPIHPLLATLVGMVGGVILSLLLDRLVTRLQRRFQSGRPDSSEESTGSEPEE